MLATTRTPPQVGTPQFDLATVLCGSFRRDPVGLQLEFEALGRRFHLLSPNSVDFVDFDEEFVRLAGQTNQPSHEIEHEHLSALRNADFVWLFAPDGYVGTSASMEVGYAHASGVPIFADKQPLDDVVAAMVTVVEGMDAVPAALEPRPGQGLEALQEYYRRIAKRRGWDNETPRDTLLLLMEELGELARAIRKEAGLRRDTPYPEAAVATELADVQLYLVHLANGFGVDLAKAVTEKEAINAARFEDDITGAA